MARLFAAVFILTISFLLVNSNPLARTHSKLTKREALGFGRTGEPLPDLFSATLDDLQAGLASGSFKSVDLVAVYLFGPLANIGVFGAHRRSQSNFKCGH